MSLGNESRETIKNTADQMKISENTDISCRTRQSITLDMNFGKPTNEQPYL